MPLKVAGQYSAVGERRVRLSLAAGATALFVLARILPALAEGAYDVDTTSPLTLRALFDFRVIPTDTATSWTDRGPGKTRYGGRKTRSGGSERTTRFALSQLALEVGAALPWGLSFHSQVDWEADVDDHGDIEKRRLAASGRIVRAAPMG